MKFKKLFSAFLAVAVTVSTVLSGTGALQVAAATAKPVATFSFENNLDGSTMQNAQNNGTYTGSAVYAAGKVGNAIQLGNYGLRLNVGNIGENYTVSMWVNPSQNVPEFGSLLYLGAPKGAAELWTSLAGISSGGLGLWSNGDGFGWSWALNNIPFSINTWSMVTLTQTGKTATLYINGEVIGSGNVARPLMASGNDIYIGVNHWDDLYQGLVDEVQVYDEALSAEEIYGLYDTREAGVIFDEKGFTVNETLSVYTGRSAVLKVNLPGGVSEADAAISYESADEKIASVDAYGTVSGVTAGQTTITTSVTVGDVTKTAETTVNVAETPSEFPVVAQYDMDSANGTVVTDTSGYGNNGTIQNSAGAAYVTDGDRTVLDLNSTSSNAYIDLPLSLYDDLTNKEEFTIEATFAKTASSGNTQWLFCFGSIPRSTGTNYLFYAPFFNGNTSRAGIKNASSEQLYTINRTLGSDAYYTVSMVFDNGTITMYVDGVPAGPSLASGYSMESIVSAGTSGDILGFIGRSCWSPDPYFAGRIDSFKVYDQAMTEEEVQIANPEFEEKLKSDLEAVLTESAILGSYNRSLSEVRYDMNLIDEMDGLDIVWTSSRPDIIAADGTVTNPEEDTNVTLIATVRYGVLAAQVTFEATAKALDITDLQALIKEAEALDEAVFAEGYDGVRAVLDNIGDLSAIKTQQEALDIEIAIKTAVSKLVYIEDYTDPWAKIEAAMPKEEATYQAGDSEVLFTVPEGLENCVTVSYSSDNEEVATYADGEVKALKAGTAILTLTVTAKYDGWTMEYGTYVTVEGGSVVTPDLPYEDVEKGAWYYDVIYYNYEKGYMTGKSATIFAPDATLTRAELTSILYRINGEPEVTYEAKFTDVPADSWYAAPIIWASKQGVVNGYAEGDFKPDDAITREQLAVIMHNYATAEGIDTNKSADLSIYKDAEQVSGWVAPAVQWAVATGVLSGKNNGESLDPLGNATRAEAAAIIQRFMENIAK